MCRHDSFRFAIVGIVCSFVACAVGQQVPELGRTRTVERQVPATQPTTQPASTQPADGPQAQMKLDPQVLDFGEVWEGEPVSREFTVKNTGVAPLTMSVRSSCGCTVVTNPESPLAPGKETKFTISYTTINRPGPAHKTVTLVTNDPEQRSVKIDVKGEVKPVVEITPGRRITFQGLEMASVATETIKLENRFERPMNLKIKEGQDFGKFDIELKPIMPGKEYELSATTKPPLVMGWNRLNLVLETGLEAVPTLTIPVFANAQPRVFASPFTISVPESRTEPFEQRVRIQYRAQTPIKITDVKASLPSMKCEVLEGATPSHGASVAYHQILVTVPAFKDIPEEGAKIEIFTDDESDDYKRLEIPVVRFIRRAPPNRDGTEGVEPINVKPGELRERKD